MSNNKALRFLGGVSLAVIPTVLAYFLYKNSSLKEENTEENPPTDGPSSAARPKQVVTILYGTTTGTARNFAERTCKRINSNPLLQHAYEARALDLAAYAFEDQLGKEGVVLLICSTWTDGVAPETAREFFAWLQDYAYDFRVSKDLLSKLQFSIFGLGSAYYEANYCKHLVAAQEQLQELGASALLPLKMGDDQVDLEPKFDKWEREIFAVLRQAAPSPDPTLAGSGSGTGANANGESSHVANRAGGKFTVASTTQVRQPKAAKGAAGNLTSRGNDFQRQHQEAFGKPVGQGGANKRSKDKAGKTAAGAAGAAAGECETGKADGACCNASADNEEGEAAGGCCQTGAGAGAGDEDEEEEEDRINMKFVTMDLEDRAPSAPAGNRNPDPSVTSKNANLLPPLGGDSDDSDDENKKAAEDEPEPVLDLEELGPEMQRQLPSTAAAAAASSTGDKDGSKEAKQPQEMVTKLQRKALTKEGYRIIGTHSAVKLCRWTKNQMRGRGGCYKHTFYGITSYQCMEATPSLACANKCVFCWRHHKNPVGTEWRWKEDDPVFIVNEAVELHRAMINEMRGVPGVLPERLAEALSGPYHCALSLVGEPIMYPRINEMLAQLHNRGISSFMVTNAQFPAEIASLDPVTQLYVSVDASNKESLKAIDRPLFRDYWDRFLGALQELSKKRQRTVYRLTLVSGWNMDEIDGYAELVEKGLPDFIEIKAVTYCGKSDASNLTMQNVPWHKDVIDYGEALAACLRRRGVIDIKYSIATEHEHSCCILLAREDKFRVNGIWHTWIDYEKFNQLIKQYYEDKTARLALTAAGQEAAGVTPPFNFTSEDYMLATPEWAVYKNTLNTRGFDPDESRWKRTKTGKMVEVDYKSSESGCG